MRHIPVPLCPVAHAARPSVFPARPLQPSASINITMLLTQGCSCRKDHMLPSRPRLPTVQNRTQHSGPATVVMSSRPSVQMRSATTASVLRTPLPSLHNGRKFCKTLIEMLRFLARPSFHRGKNSHSLCNRESELGRQRLCPASARLGLRRRSAIGQRRQSPCSLPPTARHSSTFRAAPDRRGDQFRAGTSSGNRFNVPVVVRDGAADP